MTIDNNSFFSGLCWLAVFYLVLLHSFVFWLHLYLLDICHGVVFLLRLFVCNTRTFLNLN